ncbi:TM0106 family RecB-like putative nuclease [Brevundimonas vesicularis]|uniref:TM0106 family RecB-like putative nuclease n=1 Tax=Brevundimonas vesicularis TaxID=41276 RepID=A0ABU4KTA8_BREVE|nr:TM0106 family RecB-like putative nuclease [Brevundimonas vesicularis]MDX2336258.1 TM0106 family RecB-like putative nuclease [Brevundimonas vesicularis]
MTRLLSASRLNAFQSCRHQTALWLADVPPPERADDSIALIRKKGFEHEAVVLGSLSKTLDGTVEIPTNRPLDERTRLTQEAMNAGVPLIYQAALANDRWVGFPDFLVKTGQSGTGGWLYAPEDAKLAKKAKAEYVVQLGIYAQLIEEVTGEHPDEGAIHGSGGAPSRFKLSETQHITSRMMAQFEAFVAAPEPTRPIKSTACKQCDFVERCTEEWRAADSPNFVAGIRGDQMIKLERAGVATLSALAALPPDSVIPGIGNDTLSKLIGQARLQKRGADEGRGLVEVLSSAPLRGFAVLPAPEEGDLFYDIEGDPLYPEGLEYLHGLWGPLGGSGEMTFLPIWAHDHSAEKRAFEQLMDLFAEHLARFPRARIYHYASYEQTALKRLAMRYATRETELDRLLREQRFVDLHAVVRHAIRASTESYSLKSLEKIYWGHRSGDVTNAGDSIVEYERWRELGDQAILDGIQHYNEEDCVSTQLMRDWLETLRPADTSYGLATAAEKPEDAARSAEREQFEQQRLAIAAAVRAQSALEPELRELIAELLWFHQRSQKPQWWALFDRQTWTDDELTEDPESLGQLTRIDQVPDARSFVATYSFPPQDTKLKLGDRPRFALTLQPAGEIVEIDMEACTLSLRRGTRSGDFPDDGSLSPGAVIPQKVLVNAVMELAARVGAGDLETDRAVLDMLRRRAPRLTGRVHGDPVLLDGEDLVDGTVRAVRDLDATALIIQGPPGTGKTYTTARAIVALLADGKRVGVSSNSHKAINNVLAAVSKHAEAIGAPLNGVKKCSAKDADAVFRGYGITSLASLDDVQTEHQLVGATAFEFAKHGANTFDVLFVDEAGQVSLGNLAAMAGCARSLVLVGDQMQLPQPVQGVHPGETGLSSMDYAMQHHATVPPERGILLNVSWRMHPDVCGFISDAIYDGRLTAHASTARQSLVLPAERHTALKPTGISFVALAHIGCTQSSLEEAVAIADLLDQLLGAEWINSAGVQAPLTLDDVLIVSPFNMQVNLLKKTLRPGARIGTVDKFQGQEAPVVIVSMATSFGGDAPRGTEFLFNRNRLNVALSRAKCLAIVVCGDQLMSVPSPGLDDLPRLSLLARAEAVSAIV